MPGFGTYYFHFSQLTVLLDVIHSRSWLDGSTTMERCNHPISLLIQTDNNASSNPTAIDNNPTVTAVVEKRLFHFWWIYHPPLKNRGQNKPPVKLIHSAQSRSMNLNVTTYNISVILIADNSEAPPHLFKECRVADAASSGLLFRRLLQLDDYSSCR